MAHPATAPRRDDRFMRAARLAFARMLYRAAIQTGLRPTGDEAAFFRAMFAEERLIEAQDIARLDRIVPPGTVSGAPTFGVTANRHTPLLDRTRGSGWGQEVHA